LCAAAVATSFFTLAPALVGALIDELGLSVREVGLISSGELAGSALGSALVLLYGRQFPARVILTTALVLTGLSNLVTAHFTTAHLTTAGADGFVAIALCRVAAGLGGGIAFSVVNVAAARFRKPGHMFAAISLVQMVFGIAGFMAVPAIIRASGLTGVFTLLTVGSLGCALASGLSSMCAPVHSAPLRSSLSLTPRGALLVLSLFATFLTSTAMWTYLERIAVAAQLSSEVTRIGLSIGMISGALGSLGATVLLIRARNTDPFVIGGAALMAISTGLLIKASAPAAYWAALFGFNVALSLVTPLYQTELAAESGGEGPILVAMLAMYLGLILGPVLGAALVTGLGYQSFIQISAALFLTAGVLASSSALLRPQVVRS